MANFQEQLQKIFADYQEVHGDAPTALEDVAAWAVMNGKFRPEARSVVKLCREALADSLRQEKRADASGETYRSKHSIRETVGGKQLTLWADIDTAPVSFMQKSFGQRRKGIVADCVQMKIDVDHFNAAHPKPEHQYPLILDFTDDVLEAEHDRTGERHRAA